MDSSHPRPVQRLLVLGVLSVGLYALLYLWERPILAWTTRGGWYFLLPVGLAFVFSFVHGGFTGCFWQVLGVRAKAPGRQPGGPSGG